MKTIYLTDKNANQHTIELQDSKGSGRTFIVGLHKAGSVLLNHLVQNICTIARKPTFSIEEYMFSKGLALDSFSPSEIMKIDLPGYVYTGFRTGDVLKHFNSLANSPIVLLVRDLRDVATSYYFSMAYSHALPGEGESRELFEKEREIFLQSSPSEVIMSGKVDHVLDAANFFAMTIDNYANLRLYRYEDVIFQKQDWVRDLCEFLGTDLLESEIASVADRHDARPSTADKYKHVRQVWPGNYKEHLNSDAQNYINRKCGTFYDVFRYEH